MKFYASCFVLIVSLFGVVGLSAEPNPKTAVGVPIHYQLPGGAAGSSHWQVTLAIVDAKNPAWIISTFVAGAQREVTAENQGQFTEIWDGLDDNFMPVPPGDYAVKGIYSPARQWPVDAEWHVVTPLFAGGASSWLPTAAQRDKPVPFGGDPVNAPLRDVAVGPNGVAVFYYEYLENGTNCPLFDLNKPINYEQFVRAFASGGAGGGSCATTDGETVWAFSTDGGPKYVYRADQKSFGNSPNANRRNCYLPEGWVTALANARDDANGKTYVFVAQRGKIKESRPAGARHTSYHESADEFVDQITVHDGENGKVVATMRIARPQGLAVHANRLYALHRADGGWAVSQIQLSQGTPVGDWQRSFTVPAEIKPFDLEIDRSGRFYLSDTAANKVYQLGGDGKVVRQFGRLSAQKPGAYDRETLMAPAKLATWRDQAGLDRLLIVEMDGPNRVSEWDTQSGMLLREFMSHQTKCNNGYAIDPEDASLVYLPGQGDWLTRFKINRQTREWTVDAVWPGVVAGQRRGLDKPVAVRVKGNLYLASEKTLLIYRLAGDRWLRSAGLIEKGKDNFLWHDANGNGEVDDDELRSTKLPGQVITYHGQRWLADLSYVAPAQGGQDVWRLAPEGFDAHGNPIFREWKKLVSDPIFAARAQGTATALFGGNEVADKFTSDWMQVDGSLAEGFYIQARGHNFNANEGGQHKISRYAPDGQGGYRLQWRVGRSVLGGAGQRGEIRGAMRVFKPINGLLTVIDQSRSGLLLFTEEGLFVDTLFPASDKSKGVGVYQQPGEFFAGTLFPDAKDGKIYYAAGKYTPLVYELEGWSLKTNPVKPIDTLPKTVSIRSAQIAAPPEIAVSIRGGAGQAKLARFAPALGGAVLDGSLRGWEAVEPVNFASGEKAVEVRGQYDPEHLYLRWHVKLNAEFKAQPLPPLERLFTHEQASDTVGFYIQGDVNAAAGGPANGRPGDVRFVAGLFQQGDGIAPAAVALYPQWSGKDAQPQVYRTPVNTAAFAHVGPIPGAQLRHVIDADRRGFVLTAMIPRAAIPALRGPLGSELRTRVNFDANLGGHQKFWWANSDGSASRETYDEPSEARLYPGSWAPAAFQGLEQGAVVRNWLVLGPFGGPGAENFKDDPQNKMKDEVRTFYEKASYPPDRWPLDFTANYSGELVRGWWKDSGRIQWKTVPVADLDTRAIVGRSAQVWYGAAWVYAPAATEVDLALHSHPMTPVRWFVNGTALTVADKDYTGDNSRHHLREATRTVRLNAGWNEVVYRAYNFGYTPFRVGLVVKAPPEKLWTLKLSAVPPLAKTPGK